MIKILRFNIDLVYHSIVNIATTNTNNNPNQHCYKHVVVLNLFF